MRIDFAQTRRQSGWWLHPRKSGGSLFRPCGAPSAQAGGPAFAAASRFDAAAARHPPRGANPWRAWCSGAAAAAARRRGGCPSSSSRACRWCPASSHRSSRRAECERRSPGCRGSPTANPECPVVVGMLLVQTIRDEADPMSPVDPSPGFCFRVVRHRAHSRERIGNRNAGRQRLAQTNPGLRSGENQNWNFSGITPRTRPYDIAKLESLTTAPTETRRFYRLPRHACRKSCSIAGR